MVAVNAEDWEGLLLLAEKGAGCNCDFRGEVDAEDAALLKRFRAWLREAEIVP